MAYGEIDFLDIVNGSNGTYNCGPAYDNVTGLGIPYGYGLAIWIGMYGGWFGNAQ